MTPADYQRALAAHQATKAALYQRVCDAHHANDERLRIAKEQRMAAAADQEPVRASRLPPGMASTAATVRR